MNVLTSTLTDLFFFIFGRVVSWTASLETMGNVSTTGHTYNFYQYILVIPLFGLYAIAAALFCLYFAFRHFKMTCCSDYRRCDTDSVELPWKTVVYHLPQLVFKVYEESRGEGVKEVFIRGRKLLPASSDNICKVLVIMEILLINSISLVCCASLVFWNIFLVEQTFACDPGLDCYIFNPEDGSLLQQSPIENCSDFEFADNVKVQCFHFTFQFGAGIAAFGGLLKFGEITLQMFVTAVLYGIDFFYE